MVAPTGSVPPDADSNLASPRDEGGDADDATPATFGKDHLADQGSLDKVSDAPRSTKGDDESPNAHGEAVTPVASPGTKGPGALPSPERPSTSVGLGMDHESTACNAALPTGSEAVRGYGPPTRWTEFPVPAAQRDILRALRSGGLTPTERPPGGFKDGTVFVGQNGVLQLQTPRDLPLR